MVRMSILAYITLGLVVLMALLAYLANPDLKTVLTLLPMVLVLGGIPLLLNIMDRREVDKLDLSHVKPSKIREAVKKGIGERVRIRGTVHSVTNKWLNRPHFVIADDSGEIGVFMLVAPLENINCGDRIDAVGTLRWSFGLRKRDKKIWGLKMEKVRPQ